MRKVLFVAFHGPAFSGKDTCTRLMRSMVHPERAEEGGNSTSVVRFAEPIYDMIRALVPHASSYMSKEEKERPRAELGGLSVRQMAVAVGEGARRYKGDCWIEMWQREALAEALQLIEDGVERVVIFTPDLRKENERQGLLSLPPLLLNNLHLMRDKWDGLVQAASVVVHIQTRNAPVNAQFDAATETPLEYRDNDLVLMNDHAAGLEALAATLAGTFALANQHPAHSMFLDLFRLDAWREAVDEIVNAPA